jgi:cell division protein ZapB
MPSSRPDKSTTRSRSTAEEVRDSAQLGLDFSVVPEYSSVPRKEMKIMNQELLVTLENKVSELLDKYQALKDENYLLTEELSRLQSEREGLKSRVDTILGKLEGI